MSRRKTRKTIQSCCSFVLLLVFAPAYVAATPTGLNNIPTADTPPDRTVVLQAFTNMREGQMDDYVVGFKMGLEPLDVGLHPFDHQLEWGIDKRVGEGGSAPAVFQFKYAVQPYEQWPTLAIGAANIGVSSDNRRKVGQPFTYVVATHDFGWCRGHAGYGFQQKNDAAFFGLDKTIQVCERDLMLRTDVIQIDDQDQWLGSMGFIYSLLDNVAVESWVSVPFEHGKTVFTIKLNLVIEF